MPNDPIAPIPLARQIAAVERKIAQCVESSMHFFDLTAALETLRAVEGLVDLLGDFVNLIDEHGSPDPSVPFRLLLHIDSRCALLSRSRAALSAFPNQPGDPR